MAAGHATSLIRHTTPSPTSFSSSPFPSNSTVVTRVNLPITRLQCAALVVFPKTQRENSVVRVPHIEPPLVWSFQNLKIREDKDAEDVVDTVRSISKEKNIWEILNSDGSQTDISAKLPWMDPSLRYANVMWFKGAYNAQIFVSPGESEDSIVRRFRHAVAGAGVLRECYRRRYRETSQDVIKRKQRQAALQRKRRRRYDGSYTYAYKLQKESWGNNKKTKKKKESRSRPGRDAQKKVITDKAVYDSDDDDFWGYIDDDDHM